MMLSRGITHCLKTIALIVAAMAATSCNNPVFDDEGDCEVHYYLNFVYDKNLKWADAFPSEVHSVNLYVYDSNGIFVDEYSLAANEIDKPGYMMELPLPPGDYTFVAWCGLDNESGKGESFTVAAPVAGQTTLNQLTCTLNTESSEEHPVYSDSELKFLYQGNLSVNLPDSKDGADYYYTMQLTKDTNHISIILQELSGDDMSSDAYSIVINSQDGEMAWDNSLIGDAVVDYLPWDQVSDQMELTDDDGNITYNKGLIADLSVGRLMASQSGQTFLTIGKNDGSGDIVAKVPLIQYALLVKAYYEEAYGHTMTDQDFLDREDEYALTFFLYKGKWLSSYIYINSWRVILKQYEV